MEFSDSAEELKNLQRCMSDLVSVLALPAVWSGQEPHQIVATFHDALMAALNLDFIYTRVRVESGGLPIEVLKTSPHCSTAQNADRLRDALNERFEDTPQNWPTEVRGHFGGQDISLLSMRLGIEGEIGVVAAGSERANFPTQSERLLLGAAANQVTVGLQQARLLREQRRIADELDRRVAERTRELAKTNEELQLQVGLLQLLPVSAWTLKPDGAPDFVNQVWLEYSGQTLAFIQSHPEAWMTAVHPDDREVASRRFRDGVRSGQSFAIETRSLRARDGVYRWHLNQAVVLRDAEGKVIRFVGTTTDIDDQKRAQEELLASETNLRQTVNSIPGLICTMSPAGEIQELNQPLLEYFGKTPEELKGWRMTDAVHPDDLPEVVEALTYSVTTGTPYAIEHRCRRADGVYQWFQVRALAVRDADGHITGWYVLLTDTDDRKRVEEALRASERSLTLTINTIPALVWSARPDGTAESFNQYYLDYLGITQGQAQGWGWADSVHRDDLNVLLDAWQLARMADKKGECEARLRRFDGLYRWFLFRWNPLRDEIGRTIKWYGINTDIDDRKRAEDESRHSEARKAAIFDSALDCIVTIDHEGCITDFNPAAEHTFGYRRGEVMSKRLSDIMIPPSEREKHRKGLAHYLATGEARFLGKRLELTAMRADGTEFPVELAISRIPMDGQPSFTGCLRDITERRRAEGELRRSEAFLAEGQRLSRTGSFFWRVGTEEIVWSEQLYRIFEFDPGLKMTLELIASRIHPEDIHLLQEMVEGAQSGDELEHEYRILLPDSTVKYLHVVAHGTRNNEGHWEYVGAVQDATERRLSGDALEKARSELANVTRITSLGMLTASIAHEVNQPLSGIVTNASTCLRMLSSDQPNIEGARETARRTIRDGNRASEVIARLRALFRKKEVAAESIDLNDAAREVIALLLGELQSGRIVVRQEFNENLPAVKGDRIQLQQVMLNLLRNASEAMRDVEDRPRLLLIKTECEDGKNVQLTVQDTGVGLAPDAADRLFESFYTTKDDGMGIGLSVSRSIIEAHRGRLWASPNEGPGSSFAFSIPYDYSAEPA